MSWITIILFFVYTWGLGFTATTFLKESGNFLERNIMRVGIGLSMFPILAILLNFLRIPLDWRIFLAISLVFPLIILIKNKKIILPKIKLTKSNISIFIVFILFFLTLFMYTKGAFSYPYLEDEDCWGHAVGVKYVAVEKNAYDPDVKREGLDIDPVLSYIDPYPPAYDILMGILHQTSASLKWTLKFFNALIISLGILFFYFFAKQFIGDRNKAVFATFVLAMIPCYLSHFIWAHSLVITLFFPLMYCFERIKIDKKWAYLSALIMGSIWVTQNFSQPIKLTILVVIYLIVKSITHRKFQKRAVIATVSGILMSFLWWGVMLFKYGIKRFFGYYGGPSSFVGMNMTAEAATDATISSNFLSTFIRVIKYRITTPGGTGTRPYVFGDFFFAKADNMINNPIGIGTALTILTLISVIYILIKYKSSIVEEKNNWIAVSFFWLIFTFWAVNGATFGFAISPAPFRVWLLLAIPIALLVSEGVNVFKGIPTIVIVSLLVFLIFFTSGQQKYQLNTSLWPTSGSFMGGPQEAIEYANWFETLPPNTNVFLYSPRDKLTIGFDAYSCMWCQDVIDFRSDILNKNAEELHSFLKSYNYEYLIIGMMDSKYMAKYFGEERMNELLPKRYEEIQASGLFSYVYHKEGIMMVFRVV